MENIKLYELEETYRNEESSLEYPTVSYTKDTDKVWYIKKIQDIPYEISEWFVESISESEISMGQWYNVKYSNLFEFVKSYYDEHKYYDEDYEGYRCDMSAFTLYGNSCNDFYISTKNSFVRLFISISSIEINAERPDAIYYGGAPK